MDAIAGILRDLALFTMALATLPITLELLFVTAGIARRRSSTKPRTGLHDTRLAVLIPAHDEQKLLPRCLSSIRAARASSDTPVLVVADNCTDSTAQVAADAGVRVLIRNDLGRRGKGHALRLGFEVLIAEHFDAVLIVDADSVVSDNLLEEIRCLLSAGADAVQCRYLAVSRNRSATGRAIELAFVGCNVVRPLGRSGWNLSAGLFGNGCAFTRRALQLAPVDVSSLVEDLEQHLQLVSAGLKVQFADRATVWSEVAHAGSVVQRSRWEGGRLRAIRRRALTLAGGVMQGQLRLLEPLLDLLGLPIALQVLVLGLLMAIAGPTIQLYAIAALGVTACHVAVAVFLSGNLLRSLGALAGSPFYIVSKLTMIRSIVRTSRVGATWIRTERDGSPWFTSEKAETPERPRDQRTRVQKMRQR